MVEGTGLTQPVVLCFNTASWIWAALGGTGHLAIFTHDWLVAGHPKDYGKTQITVVMATAQLAPINGRFQPQDVYLQPSFSQKPSFSQMPSVSQMPSTLHNKISTGSSTSAYQGQQ